ncbi:hypothetical protein T05_8071 [Trichinella murrelli]|uniref:Uncharacterized protein n=1 Tax=Trichinella murrelli TaxID=144512 RepID=A0A0V0TSV7_9BILA|nr:hypothetical protein T05_8071 [Trichinella murrelli]
MNLYCMFRTEQHRPSRCDLARGWRTEVAGRTRTVQAPRRPDCYLTSHLRSANTSQVPASPDPSQCCLPASAW